MEYINDLILEQSQAETARESLSALGRSILQEYPLYSCKGTAWAPRTSESIGYVATPQPELAGTVCLVKPDDTETPDRAVTSLIVTRAARFDRRGRNLQWTDGIVYKGSALGRDENISDALDAIFIPDDLDTTIGILDGVEIDLVSTDLERHINRLRLWLACGVIEQSIYEERMRLDGENR